MVYRIVPPFLSLFHNFRFTWISYFSFECSVFFFFLWMSGISAHRYCDYFEKKAINQSSSNLNHAGFPTKTTDFILRNLMRFTRVMWSWRVKWLIFRRIYAENGRYTLLFCVVNKSYQLNWETNVIFSRSELVSIIISS